MPADVLPAPSPEALAHSARVAAHIRDEIERAGGWIDFARYMELALYAPGLGYYSAGARKLGRDGDFTTAPEMTPLFGAALAQPAQEILAAGFDSILEVGAGSGALAAALLAELETRDALPRQYLILELSADLRERSRDTLAARVPHLLDRVAWLNRLPPEFDGLVIGNEVLDAMPVHVIRTRDGAVDELGVKCVGEEFAWSPRAAGDELAAEARRLGLPPGYTTEIALAARGFIASLARSLRRGVALFLDYGFPEREYYHPQRAAGTLMCHYRHRAHGDPFFLPGLQDVTAHVDFTAVARAGRAAKLGLLGYATQAQFLIGCGITDLIQRVSPDDTARYLPMTNAVQRLIAPTEMGELFKAIALGRDAPPALSAFARGDRSHTL